MSIDDEGWSARFLKRLEDNHIASRSELVGCSLDDIHKLEARYAIKLPRTYRWYLETMGHKSGLLFTWDHFAVSYDHVLSLTDNYRSGGAAAPIGDSEYEDDEEFGDEDDEFLDDFPRLELPDEALIILGRLGSQFHYIVCNDEDDSPVFYLNADDLKIAPLFPSLKSWLEFMATDAERAIAGGYFEQYPGGTTP